jgi:hypothetical protein
VTICVTVACGNRPRGLAEDVIHGDGTGLDNRPDLLAIHQFSDGRPAVPGEPRDFFERMP